ncbi:MAG: isoprenyl transferase [Alphaproteobacteria bacterium]|nr:isoprenyl transferase [Alphaproteobacteria bacterium]
MRPAPSQDAPSAPCHVAIIMDGNGRWAKARGLPRVAGHRSGADAVRRAIIACRELGVRYLTLYAFSSENWKRPQDEVDDLMGLLRHYLRRELAELHKNNIRVRVIGDRSRLAPDIQGLIGQAEQTTAANDALTLVIAVNYGSHAEIVAAARRIAQEVKEGRLDPAAIDERLFSAHLETVGIPDPDLLIRTSGELRLSNFLLWQAAYSELVFIDTLWPDFDKKHLLEAISEYRRRERRYGASSG